MESVKPTTPPDPAALAELAREARKLLAFQQAMGIDDYPATPELRRLLRPGAADASAPKATPTPTESSGPRRIPASVINLADIREEMGDCQRCPRHAGRAQIVFGQGENGAKLFLVGEFPASEEAAAGSPFQGEAGELLTRMLAAIGLNRADVYCTTLVKCRPGDGHEPRPEEIAACLPFLLQQLGAVRPKVICAMGGLAAQALLHTRKNLLQLRGTWHTCQQIPLMSTFSPAFLLRNPEMKKAAWVDLQHIQKRLTTTARG